MVRYPPYSARCSLKLGAKAEAWSEREAFRALGPVVRLAVQLLFESNAKSLMGRATRVRSTRGRDAQLYQTCRHADMTHMTHMAYVIPY